MDVADPVFVTGGGGTRIATYQYGNDSGRPLVFVHGFNQCHLCWRRQFESPLSANYRMIGVDLRGHGNSDKPLAAEAYSDQAVWAADIAAVIDELALERPVLIGWSYGGHVLNAYLGAHGGAGLAGLAYVGAITVAGPDLTAGLYLDETRALMQNLVSADAYQAMAAVRAFVDLCFEVPPDRADLEEILAYNMIVPCEVRRALRNRTIDAADILAAIDIPTLVIHGACDRVVLPASARSIASQVKTSRLSLYDGIGHAPFHEASDRFNRELGDFADALGT